MASSLLVLLDDIATILDDVSAMTKVAAKKTAGVLGALTPMLADAVAGIVAGGFAVLAESLAGRLRRV